MYLVDTYAMPTDAELNMPGCVGMSRYVSHQAGKTVTLQQVQHAHAMGKWVSLNPEDSATGMLGGAGQGATDGGFFTQIATGLHAPRGIAGYSSADFQATPAQITDDIKPYFREYTPRLRDVGYLSGCYGDYDVLEALLSAGLIDLGWQTVAWSQGRRVAQAVLYQDVFTQQYDKDEIFGAFIGAWLPSGAQARPVPTKPASPTRKATDVFYILQDQDHADQAYVQFENGSVINIEDIHVVNAYRAAGVPVLPLPYAYIERLPGALKYP